MSIIQDLEFLSGTVLFQYLVIIGCLICPSFIFLFLFCKEIFLSLPLSYLIILSIAISIPIYVTNIFSILFCLEKHYRKKGEKIEKGEGFDKSLMLSGMFSMIIFYIPIGVGYFLNFNARNVIISTLVLEAIVVLSMIIENLSKIKR